MIYPEVVELRGTPNRNFWADHIISIIVIAAGVANAVINFPIGLLILVFFGIVTLIYELWVRKKAKKEYKVSLYLRMNPVQASSGSTPLGPLASGAIKTEMDDLKELGFRATPKSKIIVWKFGSDEDAKVVAKRLLEYLPRDS